MKTRQIIKQILRESIELDHSIRRRLNVNQQEMIDRYKKEVLRNFKYEKDLKIIIDKSSRDAAFEILDYIEAWRDLPQAKAMNELKVLSQYLYKNYGDMMMDFIRNTFDENHIGFDDFTYVFHKHSNRNGTGNGFSDGYQTWFELLKQKASWFSDLNWNEIKSKLDKQNGPASVLIKSPGDEGNMYNYYFSIRKEPRR